MELLQRMDVDAHRQIPALAFFVIELLGPDTYILSKFASWQALVIIFHLDSDARTEGKASAV